MNFATRLRELRTKHELTQSELGQIFGVTKQTISSYENGGSEPDFSLLLRISDHFGVSVDYLVGKNAEDPPNSIMRGRKSKADRELEDVAFLHLRRLQEAVSTLEVTDMIRSGMDTSQFDAVTIARLNNMFSESQIEAASEARERLSSLISLCRDTNYLEITDEKILDELDEVAIKYFPSFHSQISAIRDPGSVTTLAAHTESGKPLSLEDKDKLSRYLADKTKEARARRAEREAREQRERGE